MKAVIWTKYGSPDGLKLREVAKPVPKDNEVLVKIHATTASAPDTELRRLKVPLLFAIPLRLYLGLLKPARIKILGTEFAGEIESVGKDVTRCQPGDQVYGYTGLRMGAYAEYMCLPEKPSSLGGVMAQKPDNLTYAQAAAVPFGGLEALHALRQANIRPGQKVCIVGAGGTVGTYAVQLARHYGAEVTAVDKAGKFEMLRSIGAQHVIDYTREDFTKSSQAYDVILDTGGKSSYSGSLRALKEDGTYLNAKLRPGDKRRLRGAGYSGAAHSSAAHRGKRIIPWTAGYSVTNLLALKELIEAGTIKPVIDRTYPLEQAAEAHRYAETGEKKGNIVITVEHRE